MHIDPVSAHSPQPWSTQLRQPGWTKALLGLGLVIGITIALFHETAWSIVWTWAHSQTFAHGFMIVPITIWLIWQKRGQLINMHPVPTYRPLALTVPVGLVWLLGNLADVLVVQEFAFVGLLVIGIWAVIGTPVARFLAFPIGFLFLGVPAGEALVHPLMSFTADFTVGMLRLSGIPVYREGMFFSIPSGDWQVAQACSGLRYLIASIALGVLFAYLTYTKLWKRLLFVLFAIGLPIIANGIRAYLIVMIAHLSNNELAHGIDHFIYGWLFFGFVVTIMFVVGAIWRDIPSEVVESDGQPVPPQYRSSLSRVALLALVLVAFWPALAWSLSRSAIPDGSLVLNAPPAAGGWALTDKSAWDWRPHVVGPDAEVYRFYSSEQNIPVGLYLGVYRTQRQGAELLGSRNELVQRKDDAWADVGNGTRTVRLNGKAFTVNQTELKSRRGRRLLVWSWYQVSGRHTANPYLGKLYQVLGRLVSNRQDAVLTAVAAPDTEVGQRAAPVLQAFLNAMTPGIEAELDRVVLPAAN